MTITPTQADRDAAAELAAIVGYSGTICFDIRQGIPEVIPHEYPKEFALVQAFAAHAHAARDEIMTEITAFEQEREAHMRQTLNWRIGEMSSIKATAARQIKDRIAAIRANKEGRDDG